MLTKLCSDLATIRNMNRQYRNCIRLMALGVIHVFFASFMYATTQNQILLYMLGVGVLCMVFGKTEALNISGLLSSYTAPILKEISPQGRTEDIGNPDRMFYALEIVLLEMESGYMVARAAHNLNVMIGRLSKLDCCVNSIATKFYRVFTLIDKWRPSEYICGMWVFSTVFTMGVFAHNFFIYGEYSIIGMIMFGLWVTAVWNNRILLDTLFADLYMTRLYYNNPEKYSEAFSIYNDNRFLDVPNETV